MFLTAEQVSLRALEAQDYTLLTQWLNDRVTTYYMFYGQYPSTYEQVYAHFKAFLDQPEKNIVLMIETTALSDRAGSGSVPVGFTGLYDLNLTSRSGEFRILIGDSRARGLGLGTKVAELMAYYAFTQLNLHRLSLGVCKQNIGAVASYMKAGYIQEGTLRHTIFRNGEWYDCLMMSILEDEYRKRLLPAHAPRFAVVPPQVFKKGDKGEK